MTLREALAYATRTLNAANIDGAARDARALVALSAGIAPDRITLEGDMALADTAGLEALLQRRINREPVSKILGKRLFWGHEFTVTPDTLDPRPETESLIAAALEIGQVERFADLGTGTGIIAISLLKEWPQARAVATDVSPEALVVAQANAEALGVQDRLSLVQTVDPQQWVPPELGKFDMILSNPPYISDTEMAELSPEVSDHDPHLALTPGGDGLAPYRVIAGQVATHLAPSGAILVEIGWRQGKQVRDLFENAGFSDVRILPDLDGRDRVVQARKS